MIREIRENGLFVHNYGLLLNGESVPVSLRAVLTPEGDREKIILGVSRINAEGENTSKKYDELLLENAITKEAYETEKRTSNIYARLQALLGNYMCVYDVDPITCHYREFSASAGYEESFGQAKEGTDFFTTLREAAGIYSHPDDQNWKRDSPTITKRHGNPVELSLPSGWRDSKMIRV